MKIIYVLSIVLAVSACNGKALDAKAKKADNFGEPFGWVTCNSLTTSDDYQLTGGGDGSRIVLKSNGGDMTEAITSAIKNYDVVVFDGSEGHFMMSAAVNLTDVHNKTLFGINGAVLESIFHLTKEMMADFDAIDVEHSGHELLNPRVNDATGLPCKNMRTVNYHNIIFKYTGDLKSNWLKSGAFWLYGCTNWIIRNITMIGPGSISSGHTGDVVTLAKGCKHIWVDHCTITDGADGNFDITSESDFITVSYCKFEYTERSYGHRLCCLIGGNVNTLDPGKLNITFAFCLWANNTDYGVSRQPMVRYGHVHVYNCYYPATRNATIINARDGSNMLVEANCFQNVERFFADSLADNFIVRNNAFNGNDQNLVKGSVEIPYKYDLVPANKVPGIVLGENGAGTTLKLQADSRF